jgi:hypothetical protein
MKTKILAGLTRSRGPGHRAPGLALARGGGGGFHGGGGFYEAMDSKCRWTETGRSHCPTSKIAQLAGLLERTQVRESTCARL